MRQRRGGRCKKILMFPILHQAQIVMPHYEGSSSQLLQPRQLSQAGFKACDYMLLILLIRPPPKDIWRPLIG